MPERLGILGGTFDPVHMGHLRIAEEAVDQLRLDGLLFIPAASPPHKVDRVFQSFEHRCAMLEAAIADNPRFSLSTIERELPGRSYTVATLRKLHSVTPRCVEYYFLVGMDGFLELDTWWKYRELFQLARIVVLERPGYSVADILMTLKRTVSPLYEVGADRSTFVHPHLLPVHALKSTLLDISSTEIRQLLAAGRSIRYLVTPGVLGYIGAHALYRPPGPAACAATGTHASGRVSS
ncbi:MAG: nicotinate-nucleotide adenylyltransferase [Syntrophobacteraceae bacterium]